MRVKTLLEPPEALLQELLREVRSSRKYRDLDIPEETLRDLLTQALERQPNSKAALKVIKDKKDYLEKVVSVLLEKETIEKEEFDALMADDSLIAKS